MKTDTATLWPDITLQSDSGVPTLALNNAPTFGWTAHRPFLPNHVEAYERLHRAGLRHIQIDATCSEDIFHPELRFWTGPNTYDGTAQDEWFKQITQAAPDSLIQLRIYCGCPQWWIDANPDEAQIYADGSREHSFQRCDKRAIPSLASEKWRRELKEALRQYIQWLIDSGWSQKVSVLFLGNGITWEWGILGTDKLPDYSASARSFFENWLREKYTDDANLSDAWGRDATIKDAQIPTPERRTAPGEDGLRALPEFQDVVDHQQSLSDMNVTLLIDLADTARESTGAEGPLIGCFYGYTLSAREQSEFTGRYGAGGLTGGHHAFQRLLRSDSIDMISSPFNYANRRPENGVLMEHVALRSVQIHGKVFFDENDNYTFDGKPEDERDGTIDIGISHSLEEERTLLHWAWGSALVRGKHQWFTELNGWVGPFKENFSNPDTLAEIERLNTIADDCMSLNRSPQCEVAVVLDERAIAYLSLDNKEFRDRIYQCHPAWMRHAAPVDFILSDDLNEADCPQYKLLIPAGPMTNEARASIQQYLEQNDCLLGNAVGEFPPETFNSELPALMERAGVHRYLEGNANVWSSTDLIHIQIPERRTHTLHFPHNGCVKELLSGDVLEIKNNTIERSFTEWDVQVFARM
jgi:hypothetical protein